MTTFASERQFQSAIVTLARATGWLVFHVTDSRKSTGVGFPDLVLVHRETGRTLFWELKYGRGRVSPEQNEWLDALSFRQEIGVIRPDDWQQVQDILLGESRAVA